jgi:hypothetical protein
MVNWLIDVSLRNRFLIIVGCLLVGGWGYWALLTTPIDAIPDLSDNQVIVFTDWPERREPEGLPEHPVRRARFRTSVRAIAYPQIPIDSALRTLYTWDPLRHFIAVLLGLPQIYRYYDPYGALNIAVMIEGDAFGWHFDQTDFVVSLALQRPAAGGKFLCRHAVRSDAEANDDAVQAVIENRCPAITTVPMHEGSFMLFKGRHALHRVIPIQGPVPRLVALLAYDTQPGMVSSAALLKVRYGIEEPVRRVSGADQRSVCSFRADASQGSATYPLWATSRAADHGHSIPSYHLLVVLSNRHFPVLEQN